MDKVRYVMWKIEQAHIKETTDRISSHSFLFTKVFVECAKIYFYSFLCIILGHQLTPTELDDSISVCNRCEIVKVNDLKVHTHY